MRWIALVVVIALIGCAVFEQTPTDVQQKLADPTKGHLYERDPLERN